MDRLWLPPQTPGREAKAGKEEETEKEGKVTCWGITVPARLPADAPAAPRRSVDEDADDDIPDTLWYPVSPREKSEPSAKPRLAATRAINPRQTPMSEMAPAGKRAFRMATAWAARGGKFEDPAVGAGAALDQAQGASWKENRKGPPTELRHDPILHQVEVFVRGIDGDVQLCRPGQKGYYEVVRKAAAAPLNVRRRKALSEYLDVCNKSRANPNHQALLERNKRAFSRQQGPCSEWLVLAQAYPGNPVIFEPKTPRDSSPSRSKAPEPAAVPSPPPPRESRPRPWRQEGRPASARVRRPVSAREASALAAKTPAPQIRAPPR